MSDTSTPPIVITYLGWNTLTVIYFIIVIIALIISIITVRLIVLNDYYDKLRVCEPIYFFIGKKTACKKFIKKAVRNAINENSKYSTKLSNKQIIKRIIENDTFQTQNNETDIELPNSWDMFINTYNKFKETIHNNYLAMVRFIRSLVELFRRVVYTTLRKATE